MIKHTMIKHTMIKHTMTTFIMTLFLSGVLNTAHAVTMTYTDRSTFETQLATMIVDDYSAEGYQDGDILNPPVGTIDIFSDAGISSVIGETDYTATSLAPQFRDNYIHHTHIPNNDFYCVAEACVGPFELGFTTTSVGDETGVFGAGFDKVLFAPPGPDEPIYAFVTFGDGSTMSYELTFPGFFGITSDLMVQSIHVSEQDLGPDDFGLFLPNGIGIDNLTIGAPIPEPSTMLLLGTGLAGLVAWRRKSATK